MEFGGRILLTCSALVTVDKQQVKIPHMTFSSHQRPLHIQKKNESITSQAGSHREGPIYEIVMQEMYNMTMYPMLLSMSIPNPRTSLRPR
jgi:hypothetical protein